MASFTSKMIIRILRHLKFNERLSKMVASGDFHRSDVKPHKYLEKSCIVDHVMVDDRVVYSIEPKKHTSDTWVFYLHGGAYVHGFDRIHWWFLRKLIRKTGCNIFAPDYPLLPQATSEAMYDMIEKAYDALCQQVSPKHIVFMGDSAGGGLALGFAQWLRDKKQPTPNRIVLLSPWLDITMDDPMIREIQSKDPILKSDNLMHIGHMLAGTKHPKDPLLSPLFGDLSGLGKVIVFAGTYDILVSDARRLSDKMKQQSLDIDYHEYLGMPHVWMLLGMPESKQVIDEIDKSITT